MTLLLESKLRRIASYMNPRTKRLPRLPNALLVTYEKMRADPHGTLRRVAEFVDGPFTPEEIDRAVAFAAFDTLQRRERAGFFTSFRLRPGDPQSYKIRRGKVGGYRDDFTPEQAAIRRLSNLMLASLNARLG